MANDITEEILKTLDAKNEIDTFDLATLLNEDHQKVIGAVKSLQALGNMVTGKKIKTF